VLLKWSICASLILGTSPISTGRSRAPLAARVPLVLSRSHKPLLVPQGRITFPATAPCSQRPRYVPMVSLCSQRPLLVPQGRSLFPATTFIHRAAPISTSRLGYLLFAPWASCPPAFSLALGGGSELTNELRPWMVTEYLRHI
jgi:hypothetical protein